MTRTYRSGRRPTTPGEQLLVGVILLLAGSCVVLGGLGVEPFGRTFGTTWITVCGGLVFVVAGAGICLHTLSLSNSRQRNTSSSEVSHTILPYEGIKGMVGFWIVAIILSLLMTVFWGSILSDAPSQGNMPDWMVYVILGVFTIIAILLTLFAIWLTLSAIRFGKIPLFLTEHPVRIGNQLEGFIEFSHGSAPQTMLATLIWYQVPKYASPFQLIRRNLKGQWSDIKEVIPTDHSNYDRVIINFDIPTDKLPTNCPGETTNTGEADLTKDYSRWKLSITAKLAGINLRRTYDIPIEEAK